MLLIRDLKSKQVGTFRCPRALGPRVSKKQQETSYSIRDLLAVIQFFTEQEIIFTGAAASCFYRLNPFITLCSLSPFITDFIYCFLYCFPRLSGWCKLLFASRRMRRVWRLPTMLAKCAASHTFEDFMRNPQACNFTHDAFKVIFSFQK